MRGAVAAGHPLTAEAGARILSEGGNAVDACVAATLVSWVAESTLTGPGGGGYLLARRARDGSVGVLDFFVAAPGLGFSGEARAMPSVDIWFDPSVAIPYLVGAPSCAVPGVVAGLAEGHRRLGRLPWAELFAPAIEIARAGVPISAAQARLHTLLDPILRLEPEGRRLYGADGPLGAGEEPDLTDLATAFEILARDGADAFYRGELAHAMLACVREGGGRLTAEDLASYRAVRRRPIRAAFRDTEFMTCPPSSAGGVLIAFALSVLDRLGPPAAAGSAEQISRLAEVMREATLARGGSFVRDLTRGGLAGQLLAPANVEAAAERARAGGPPASEALGLPSTTHVSVVDGEGNVASLSASTGAGSGVDRRRDRDPPEQHARRERPACPRDHRLPGQSAGEHDGALARPARRRAATRDRQRRLRAAAKRDPADGRERDRPRPGRAGGDRRSARPPGGRPAERGGRDRPGRARRARASAATTSRAGRPATCSSAASPRSRSPRPASWPPRAIRGAAAPGPWSRERPARRGRGRRGPGRAGGGRRSEPEGWLITDGEWRSVGEERRYLRAIRRSSHAAVLVAEADDRIVGRLSISRDPHPASRHVADVGLMVAQDARRTGVGRALMQGAEEWARAVGVTKIELHVFPYNTAALALYDDLGFRREGLRIGHYLRGGEFLDVILMAKEIR